MNRTKPLTAKELAILREKVEANPGHILMPQLYLLDLLATIDRQREQVRALWEALEWYADEKRYQGWYSEYDPNSDAIEDNGQRARQALANTNPDGKS